MGQESFTFKGANGQEIFCWRWDAAAQPLGVLQIFHGMAEHAGRYADFAQYLNTQGFTVYACDMRGHGRTGELNGDSCHMGKGGFIGSVEDQALLMNLIKEKHPGVPLTILGHSFGSFLAQEFIKHHGGEIAGLILSGSSYMKGADISAGYVLAKLSMLIGSRRPNKLLDKLSFGSYNKRIQKPSSKFSWLSRDENQVKKYEESHFCGNVMSAGFFESFFTGLMNLYKNMEGIPGRLPVYIISGAEDPVGKYGLGTKRLYDEYKRLGLSNLRIKIYEGARHEILNEIDRKEVYLDILNWLRECVLTEILH